MIDIVFDERLGAVFISRHAYVDGFRLIIGALDECAAAMIADVGHVRRSRMDMEHGLAIRAGAPTAEPADQDRERKGVIKHGFEPEMFLGQQFVERLSLWHGAREPIQ